MSDSKKLKAFIRYANNKAVPGSLIVREKAPSVGIWKEVTYNLCCNDTNPCPQPDYGDWKLVTGGEAGDGVVLVDEYDPEDCPRFMFVGPNDDADDGWVYLKQYFPSTTCLQIDYQWTSYDDSNPSAPPSVDFPVYWTSPTEPTGIPGDDTPQVGSTPADGTWNITVLGGNWFSIGIYSTDSCCGRGFLQVEICEVECPEPTTTTSTTAEPTTTTTTTCSVCCEPICGETYEGYGYLYNWSAIYGEGAQTNGGRNIGGIVNTSQPYADERNQWVVPSDSNSSTLITYLGGESVAGSKLKTTCTNPFTVNNGVWDSPNADATNEVNFAGVAAGARSNDGTFVNIGFTGGWWSSTQFSGSTAWSMDLVSLVGNVSRGVGSKLVGRSLRLVRPATTAELLLPDGTTSNQDSSLPHYIGNSRTYITVKIGTQVWTAQNLIEESYNNATLIPEVTDNAAWVALTTGARCSYNNGNLTPDQGQIELCGNPII